ncbi:MAG: TlpA family protein disulfide reductase [Flavobacteriaceae bacterium]|nr:TlpA family protein disulfide reductase [Flavobacteriaceae bacterium]
MACKQEPRDYVSLSGKISNPHESNSIKVFKGNEYEKIISIKEDGTFSDTLKVEEGVYRFKHGEEYGQIYLKNDNEISFTLDNDDFDNTLKFEGDNADKSNFYIASLLMPSNYLDASIFDLTEDEFNKSINGLKDGFTKLKSEFPTLDESFFQEEEKKLEGTIKSYTDYYQSKLALRKAIPQGTPSPIFKNYENYKGGTTSLSDLKGKYVYIDIWATWCGPCKREIPSLKKIEEQYHGKNIEFVSISTDNGRGYKEKTFEASKVGWKKMISEKEMGGIQLFAGEVWDKSEFRNFYKIRGIPRFILIDPAGNVVNADAPRPSSPSLVKLFESLNI